VKNLLFTTFLIFFSTNLYADYLEDIFSEIEDENAQVLSATRDPVTGISTGTYDLKDDTGRYSVIYHFNSDLLEFTTISSFEFIYGIKKGFGWLDFSVSKSSARFDQVTNNNSALGASSLDLEESSLGILTLGLGLSYRTNYIRHIFRSNTLYETVGASITYNQVDDSFRSETFSGEGLKADFGIHSRASESFHIGGKMSYNLIHTKKPLEFEGESSSSRSLLLSWVSFGIDFTFYF
jgi:hypothetical protein